MNQYTKKHKLSYYISLVVLLIVLYFAYQFYQSKNFNSFVRSESNMYTSSFTRDKDMKYDEKRSYKIESEEFNDAMFYKTIKVEKYQPYRVTCMVKTNKVEAEEEKSGIGAQICIEGTNERSVAVSGTSDWQKIEMIFNSKDRENINIGFRLGGYLGEAKGEAWFSDFTIEEGIKEENNNWKFGCFIFKNTDVTVNQKAIHLDVTQSDIRDINNTINLFEASCTNLSNRKMTADCDIYEIDTPLTKLSYDDEFGYYVSPEDVEEQIKDIVANNNYDHIFVVIRLGDEEHQNDIEINDWIGLGSMDYYGVGFSNIRLPNDSKSYVYRYNTRINTFPEEVFLHEFLHSLERNAQEYGFTRPELHDYENFGYKNEPIVGQKLWYTDYMNKNIDSNIGKTGLPNEIYTLKPPKRSNFEYSFEIKEAFKEPENIIEEIKQIIDNLTNKIGYLF